jgi:hypothetical protein
MKPLSSANLALIGALVTGGCSVSPVYTQQVRVSAKDPAGVSVSGLVLAQDGQDVGTTGPEGTLLHQVQGRAGDTVRMAVTCPQGTERLGESELLVTIVPHRKSDAPLEVPAVCRPLRHQVTVQVRAPKAPGLPIKHLGHEVGRLDGEGLATLILEAAPNQRMELLLDTQGREDLRPKNPVATFLVTDRDENFVMDQDFAVTKRAVRMAAKPQLPKAF